MTTPPIPLGDFRTANLRISPKPKKLDQGGVLAMTYAGEEVVLKLPTARVPFDASFGYKNEGSKVEVKLELPNASEFEAARRVLSAIDAAVAAYLRSNASSICTDLGMKSKAHADKVQDLQTGNKFYPLLRQPNEARYPETVTLKWAPEGKVVPAIVNKSNAPVPWEQIKRDSVVMAVIKVKGVFLNTSLTTIQVEPVAFLVTPKTTVNTATLFSDEMTGAGVDDEDEAQPAPAKKPRFFDEETAAEDD